MSAPVAIAIAFLVPVIAAYAAIWFEERRQQK